MKKVLLIALLAVASAAEAQNVVPAPARPGTRCAGSRPRPRSRLRPGPRRRRGRQRGSASDTGARLPLPQHPCRRSLPRRCAQPPQPSTFGST